MRHGCSPYNPALEMFVPRDLRRRDDNLEADQTISRHRLARKNEVRCKLLFRERVCELAQTIHAAMGQSGLARAARPNRAVMRELDTLRERGFEDRLANRYFKAGPERDDLNHPRHSRTKQGTQDAHREVVRALRAKLQDDWHKPRYIETVAGSGYRFVPALDAQEKPS